MLNLKTLIFFAVVIVCVLFVVSLVFVLQKPQIQSLSPGQALPGDTIRITGRFFGEVGVEGLGTYLSVGSQRITSSHIISWQANEIQFRVPEGMLSGNVYIRRNSGTSNLVFLSNIEQIPRPVQSINSETAQTSALALNTEDARLWNANIHNPAIFKIQAWNEKLIFNNVTEDQSFFYEQIIDILPPVSQTSTSQTSTSQSLTENSQEFILRLPIPQIRSIRLRIESTLSAWVQMLPFSSEHARIRIMPYRAHRQINGQLRIQFYGSPADIPQSDISEALFQQQQYAYILQNGGEAFTSLSNFSPPSPAYVFPLPPQIPFPALFDSENNNISEQLRLRIEFSQDLEGFLRP